MTFFNIFGTTPKPREKRAKKIIVDYREKNSLVVSYLIQHNFTIEFAQLPIADYLVDSIAVERKTITDFKASIINKRIMKQLSALKQHGKGLLIIEGIQDEDIYEGILHENAFRGFLLSVALNYQVPFIYTHNAQDTARYLTLLAKKSPKKDIALRAFRQALTDEQQCQYILEGFPGIGPVTAQKLLTHFHTLKNIANATEPELKQLIGKKAEVIIKLLNHKT